MIAKTIIKSLTTSWTIILRTTRGHANKSTRQQLTMSRMKSPRASIVRTSTKILCSITSKSYHLSQTAPTFSLMLTTPTVTLCSWMNKIWLKTGSNIEVTATIPTTWHTEIKSSCRDIESRWTGSLLIKTWWSWTNHTRIMLHNNNNQFTQSTTVRMSPKKERRLLLRLKSKAARETKRARSLILRWVISSKLYSTRSLTRWETICTLTMPNLPIS